VYFKSLEFCLVLQVYLSNLPGYTSVHVHDVSIEYAGHTIINIEFLGCANVMIEFAGYTSVRALNLLYTLVEALDLLDDNLKNAFSGPNI
jgi:hypothetical protein